MENIKVNIGELKVTRRSLDNLTASGIGSCLVITLYDPKLKIGALAHTMLPSCPKVTNDPSFDRGAVENLYAKYVSIAIDEMLKRMRALGSKKEDMESKLVGGSNMFPNIESNIGGENVLSAREKLKKVGIKIVGESVGGSIGRSVEFSVASGIITVKIKF